MDTHLVGPYFLKSPIPKHKKSCLKLKLQKIVFPLTRLKTVLPDNRFKTNFILSFLLGDCSSKKKEGFAKFRQKIFIFKFFVIFWKRKLCRSSSQIGEYFGIELIKIYLQQSVQFRKYKSGKSLHPSTYADIQALTGQLFLTELINPMINLPSP